MGLLFARMESVASELSGVMDSIEEHILDGADTLDREKMLEIRKKAIVLKRYMHPQRDLVMQMIDNKPALIDKTGYRRLIEAQDSISRVIDELDAVRERAHIINDEVTNQLTERLNKNMYALSVIAAIFLPLGFLTGLLNQYSRYSCRQKSGRFGHILCDARHAGYRANCAFQKIKMVLMAGHSYRCYAAVR